MSSARYSRFLTWPLLRNILFLSGAGPNLLLLFLMKSPINCSFGEGCPLRGGTSFPGSPLGRGFPFRTGVCSPLVSSRRKAVSGGRTGDFCSSGPGLRTGKAPALSEASVRGLQVSLTWGNALPAAESRRSSPALNQPASQDSGLIETAASQGILS